MHRELRIVRLGQGVDGSGRLAPEAIARTETALEDYADLVRHHGADAVRMVATSATRDAANRDEFVAHGDERAGRRTRSHHRRRRGRAVVRRRGAQLAATSPVGSLSLTLVAVPPN